MKLYAVDRQVFMAQRHDLSVLCPCCNFEACGQRGRIDDQGVVACGIERRRQSGKEALPTVMDRAYLSMHGTRATHDSSAQTLGDGLMAETDAQDRNQPLHARDERQANACILRGARPGADYNVGRTQSNTIVDKDRVVAHYAYALAQYPEVVDQYRCKRVEIIDE